MKSPLNASYPVLPLRDIVVFPHMIVPLFVGREKSIRALEAVMAEDKQIILVTQKEADTEDPGADGLYTIGTVGSILQLLKLPDGAVKVLVEGGERVVIDNDDVMVICPYWSGTPYELLVIPTRHELHLQDSDDDTLSAVGRGLRDAMSSLSRVLGDVAYNVGFHSAPHQHTGEYHWHIHIWPNLVTQAGFERGTGVLINIVPPEQAAATLRSVGATT